MEDQEMTRKGGNPFSSTKQEANTLMSEHTFHTLKSQQQVRLDNQEIVTQNTMQEVKNVR